MTAGNLSCVFVKFKGGKVVFASVGKAGLDVVAAVLTTWEQDEIKRVP